MQRINEDEAVGTRLQGEIQTTYEKLFDVFGAPQVGDYKTDVEWVLLIDGQVVTIYNYKDGKNYLGTEGLGIKEITNWHIGGFSKEAVEVVKKLI